MGVPAYKRWQPMKYATAKKEEVLKAALESDNYCLQLKKDGSSYGLAKDLDGTVHLYGDKISKKTGTVIDKIDNVPHLQKWGEENLMPGSEILVELHRGFGTTSKNVNEIMLALPKKAIERQAASAPMTAMIFDMLWWNGEPIYTQDFGNRWSQVELLFNNWCDYEQRPDFIELAETVYEDKGTVLAGWLADGWEGGVLKMLKSVGRTSAAHHVRELGATAARPMNTTFKIKQIDTTDVVIMAINPANKAYTGKDPENHPYKDEDGNAVNRLWALGMANGFTIGAYNGDQLVKIGAVSSGLNDEMRLNAANNPEEFIGSVIEVDCMSIDREAKTLRHPRLITMRPDKDASECTFEVIF